MLLITGRGLWASPIEACRGLYIDRLPPGTVLEVQTTSRVYTLVSEGRDEVRISGHPRLCPEPIPARVEGSTWGGSMLKLRFIGHGMHLEFQIAGGPRVRTSRVLDIRTR